MIRPALLICLFALPAAAQETVDPNRILPRSEAPAAPAPCQNRPYETSSCSRILACVGDDGLWLDGQARGWDTGTLTATASDGTTCTGTWWVVGERRAGAEMACSDGSRGWVRYVAQDSITGTGIAAGAMEDGRSIRAWTGENVLEYLREEAGGPEALLPCTSAGVLISRTAPMPRPDTAG
jgi:hypothetical protein